MLKLSTKIRQFFDICKKNITFLQIVAENAQKSTRLGVLCMDL